MEDVLSKNVINDGVKYTQVNKISDKQFTKISELISGHAYGWETEMLITTRDKSKQKTEIYQDIFFVLNKTDKWVFIMPFRFSYELKMYDYAKGKFDFFTNEPRLGRYYCGPKTTRVLNQDLLNKEISYRKECNITDQQNKEKFLNGSKKFKIKAPFANKYPHYDILRFSKINGLYEYDLNLSILNNFDFDEGSITLKENSDLIYPSPSKKLYDDSEACLWRNICSNK